MTSASHQRSLGTLIAVARTRVEADKKSGATTPPGVLALASIVDEGSVRVTSDSVPKNAVEDWLSSRLNIIEGVQEGSLIRDDYFVVHWQKDGDSEDSSAGRSAPSMNAPIWQRSQEEAERLFSFITQRAAQRRADEL
jgi:actin-like ATPase involved in cell morphogenesis